MKRSDATLPTLDAEKRANRYSWIFAGVWTVVIAMLLYWNIQMIREHTRNLAINKARANFNKDQAFRFWASKHGGVYVPATEHTPPSPYLEHIPDRDIETPSGKQLTLMNPAYMIRQLNEDFGELFGVHGHITSLLLHRPENMPDEWERAALLQFEQGIKEISEFTTLDGQPYLRLMQPMYTSEGCLKCHSYQGYKIGDVRGGVSVSVPIQNYLNEERRQTQVNIRSFGVVWLLGLLGLYGGSRRLRASELKREKILVQTIEMIIATVEKRDPYTAGHQFKVAALVESIAHDMRLPAQQIEGLRFGATIHDIGKIFVPSLILNQTGKLTEAEFQKIKIHPKSGYDVVNKMDFPWPAAQMIYQHHERLDGSGYPCGIKGDEILLEAKILAVADVIDAMISDRPYRKGLTVEDVLQEITQGRGKLYDEVVVDAAVRLIKLGLLDRYFD